MPGEDSAGGRDNNGYVDSGEKMSSKPNGSKPSDDLSVDIDNAAYKKSPDDEEDPWNLDTIQHDYVPWSELSEKEKWRKGLMYPVKIILVLGFLYLFICSLDFLSSAFKLVGGKKAGEVFQQSEILSNPIAGLMIGVLVTVLVQSSSTSTSIVISMVGAEILSAKMAVPIVMGANIGTSVTNTIVAMGQITNKNDFRRAFAGATVHDMFNWLTVIVLLPLEIMTGYLFKLSDVIISSMHLNETLDLNQDLLKVITKPFTKLVVQVSSSGIKSIATGDAESHQVTLMKFCCDKKKPSACCTDKLKKFEKLSSSVYSGAGLYDTQAREGVCQSISSCAKTEYDEPGPFSALSNCTRAPWVNAQNKTYTYPFNSLNCTGVGGSESDIECCRDVWSKSAFAMDITRNVSTAEQSQLCTQLNSTCNQSSMADACLDPNSWQADRSVLTTLQEFDCKKWHKVIENGVCLKPCEFLFKSAHVEMGGPLTDEGIGAILLVFALLLLCVCLVCIVKLLHSLLQGPMAKVIKKFVNADFPGCCGYFTGYLAILIGAGMTILVQSSSIFTSTLTPLVGMGVINLDRMYPLTLGSNIGTTMTGVLAALAQTADKIPTTLQVAFCHLFFNISGIAIFYPLPFFRPPIPAAKFLGNTTAKYRWFAIVYLLLMFFALPASVFALSIPSWYVLAATMGPILLLCILVGIIKCMQAKCPRCLPQKLRNWHFLPKPCRSLEPYDRIMRKICFCRRFQGDQQTANDDASSISSIGAVLRGRGNGVSNAAFDNTKL